MTKVNDLPVLATYEDLALLYLYSPANPATPDRQQTVAVLRAIDRTETLLNKTIGAPATTKPVYADRLQLVGAKITRFYRAVGDITISALAAGAEEELTIAVTGAAVGDHVIVTPNAAAPEAGVSFGLTWVSAADTVKIRVSNLSAGALTGGNLSVAVLVIRSAAADV